ncbi:hypothetical protein EOA46_27995 [Mesorhizobium sp. M1A.F.Ca.IN.022.05.2.1]|uniref:hypothetical protein n=1 Tax=unclassified Mesorhizobium TaxID=325217 RepID=UPI000FCBC00C|nr:MULTISPECIES: hypothetical protein [unclassified Mesorhizobium]RUV81483.1 hypothetical protein EOA51_31165 [Mesorhizobium sp. M1A.F.Ca.IN.020.32.1.1]RUW05660.1 hypothetical protein EOA46_27995 [Mesorhizobium sp. M1A.F.Ca.IN.022.05.2.1]RWF71069.1 MAG: hypothetical protein EOQ35_32075 [Mesorhizobium sp.]RWG07011.1 MAG: hypothetical protein EOQ38_00010 [Mesorhizobium sp.]RWG77179.1 MAG: hypothetical protein EOQ68_21170 [Mesorhizobium sp.]
MEVLAVHGCNAEPEDMVLAGAPVHVNAVQARSSSNRDTSALRSRVENVLAARESVSVDADGGLAAFAGKTGEVGSLVPAFLAPATPGRTRLRILATLHALDFYTPELLPLAREMIAGQIHQEAQAVAAYLAEVGDGDARRIVIDWLATQDIGTASTFRRSYLVALLRYPEGKTALVSYLQRSRANGHLVVEGRFLRVRLLRGCVRRLSRSATQFRRPRMDKLAVLP